MPVLLVGVGELYETVQAASDAATVGDTIQIEAGTYAGFTVTVEGLTIEALGEVVIEGTLLSDLGVPEGTPLNDFFEDNHPAYSAASGIVVSADDVTITGLTVTGFSVAVNIGTSDGLTLTGKISSDILNMPLVRRISSWPSATSSGTSLRR